MNGRVVVVAAVVFIASVADAADAVDDGGVDLAGVRVVAYDGYGTPQRFEVAGRVLRDKAQASGTQGDSSLANVLRTVGALNTHEVPNVEVNVTVSGQSYSATSDADGMFRVRVLNLPEGQALPVGALAVTMQVMGDTRGPPTTATVFVAPAVDAVGVVSDIDDTIMKTFVPDKIKMVSEVLTQNAETLAPVTGAATAYQRAKDTGVDAVFYVSGSPQNLHARLTTFLRRHGYPLGPLFLKNLGTDPLFGHDEYKLNHLKHIAQDNPGMKFILVGDSGERDPEIYRAFQASHPDRVLGVVIRAVPGSKHLEAERFAGMVVVDDVYASDAVIAALLPAAAAETGRSAH